MENLPQRKIRVEVKYPPTWKQQETQGDWSGGDLIRVFLVSPNGTRISISPTVVKLSGTSNSQQPIIKTMEISLAGKSALRIDYTYENQEPFLFVIEFKQSVPLWNKDGWIRAEGKLADKDLVDQILSTFKFIK